MKTFLSIALCLFASVAQAASVDVTRVFGKAVIPSSTRPQIIIYDIEIQADRCVAIADALNTLAVEEEQGAANALGLTNYTIKSIIKCKHRSVPIPVIESDVLLCERTATGTETAVELMDSCSLPQ